MYSRRDEDSNINGSYGQHSANGDLVQGVQKKFDTPNRSSHQQINSLNTNRNPKIDFSIFYGQDSSLQRRPVQLNNDFQDASYQQSNAFQRRSNVESKNPRPSEEFPPKSPQIFNGNTSYLRPTTPAPFKVDWHGQNSNKNNVRDVDNQHSNLASNTSYNTLGLMGVPKPNKYSSKSHSSSSNSLNMSKTEEKSQRTGESSSRVKRYGDSIAEKLCIFTGTVERVIKWGKIFQNHFCYFEVIAAVVSIADGNVQFERIMLLRDRKGPILQVTYYSNATHINIDDFHLGQMLRAVGRIIGPNIMSAITIRAATNEEIENLPRMFYVSDRAVSTLCGDN